MLEVSENTHIPKLLMAYKIPRYRFFGFTKIPRFRVFNGNRNSTTNLQTNVKDNLSELTIILTEAVRRSWQRG